MALLNRARVKNTTLDSLLRGAFINDVGVQRFAVAFVDRLLINQVTVVFDTVTIFGKVAGTLGHGCGRSRGIAGLFPTTGRGYKHHYGSGYNNCLFHNG